MTAPVMGRSASPATVTAGPHLDDPTMSITKGESSMTKLTDSSQASSSGPANVAGEPTAQSAATARSGSSVTAAALEAHVVRTSRPLGRDKIDILKSISLCA